MLNIQQTIGTLSKKYWYETDQTQMKILTKKNNLKHAKAKWY
jgi:hypothetical protein